MMKRLEHNNNQGLMHSLGSTYSQPNHQIKVKDKSCTSPSRVAPQHCSAGGKGGSGMGLEHHSAQDIIIPPPAWLQVLPTPLFHCCV